MIFTETELKGAFVIELEKRGDERGFLLEPFVGKNLQPMA
jgi:dTDP-4-dehydrorhamnose 3,5-epimerase-like enzyme